MAKIFKRQSMEPYCLLQIRLKVRERNKLRVLCAELGISMQQFFIHLLRNAAPEVFSDRPPSTFRELVKTVVPEKEPSINNEGEPNES